MSNPVADVVAKVATVGGLVHRRNAATMVMDWLNLLKILGFYQQRWLTSDGQGGVAISDRNKKVGLSFSSVGSLLQEILGKAEAASQRLDGWDAGEKAKHAAEMRRARDLDQGEGPPITAAADGAKIGFVQGLCAVAQRIFTLNYRTPFQDTHRLMGEALCASLVAGAVAALYRGSKALRLELEPLDEDPKRVEKAKNRLREGVRSGQVTRAEAQNMVDDTHKLFHYDITSRAQLPEGDPDRIAPEQAQLLHSKMNTKSRANLLGLVVEIGTVLLQRFVSAGEVRRLMVKDYRHVSLPSPVEGILNMILPKPLTDALQGAFAGTQAPLATPA